MRLSNSEQLATLAAQAVNLLSAEGTEELPAVDRLQQVAQALSKLAAIDPNLSDWSEVAETISAQAQDMALELADYVEAVEWAQEFAALNRRMMMTNVIRALRGSISRYSSSIRA